MNNEAFIDEYGRLIDRKPHRVLKELRHFASNVQADDSDENYSYELSSPPWWIELLRDVARELWNDEEFRANVKELYHLKIKPACKKIGELFPDSRKQKQAKLLQNQSLLKKLN